jgi:hypothetical protein
MVFGFTGYLLPWDQRAYWATVVGTEIAGFVPLIGEQLLLLLRGGIDVTEATLSRFFGLHVLVLPLALAGLLAVHLTLVHQLGLANPKRPDPRGREPEGRTTPFFPNYILDELIAWHCWRSRDPGVALPGRVEQAQLDAAPRNQWYLGCTVPGSSIAVGILPDRRLSSHRPATDLAGSSRGDGRSSRQPQQCSSAASR